MSKLSSISTSDRGYVAGVLGVAFILMAAGELFLRLYLVPNDPEAATIYHYYREASPEIVAFGDSQIGFGLVEEPRVLTLARGGESARVMAIKVERYFAHREPRRVILLAAPQIFAPYRLARETHAVDKIFDIDPRWPIHIYLLNNGLGSQIPSFLQRLIDGEAMAFDYSTYKRYQGATSWSDQSPDERLSIVMARARTQQPPADFLQSPDMKAYINMVGRLAALGPRLCMVQPPLTSEYLAVQTGATRIGRFSEILTLLRSLAEDHGAVFVGIPEIDLSSRPELFADQDHLNSRGSRVYGPRLLRSCFGEF